MEEVDERILENRNLTKHSMLSCFYQNTIRFLGVRYTTGKNDIFIFTDIFSSISFLKKP